MTRPAWRRVWSWGARLAFIVALAQACGGDSSNVTGPGTSTQIALSLRGVELAQLAANCTGRLTATRPGFAPRSATIPPSGVVTLFLTPGEWTFIVEIDCLQTDGTTRHITAQQTATVGGGALALTFPVSVNASPRVAVSCSSFSPGFSCQCSASDPDGDPLRASWSSTGSLSNFDGFSTDGTCPSGTCEVTCTVTDGRGGVGSASTTVGAALGTIVIVNTDCCTWLSPGVTISGPASLGPFAIGPGSSQAISGVPAGSYTADPGVYYSGASACPSFPFTVSPGGTTTVNYDKIFVSPGSICSVF